MERWRFRERWLLLVRPEEGDDDTVEVCPSEGDDDAVEVEGDEDRWCWRW